MDSVIEPPPHPHLQGSFQTTNTKETLTATFLLHVSKSSDAVKTKSCGLEDTAQERPKKEQNPNQQLAKISYTSGMKLGWAPLTSSTPLLCVRVCVCMYIHIYHMLLVDF